MAGVHGYRILDTDDDGTVSRADRMLLVLDADYPEHVVVVDLVSGRAWDVVPAAFTGTSRAWPMPTAEVVSSWYRLAGPPALVR